MSIMDPIPILTSEDEQEFSPSRSSPSRSSPQPRRLHSSQTTLTEMPSNASTSPVPSSPPAAPPAASISTPLPSTPRRVSFKRSGSFSPDVNAQGQPDKSRRIELSSVPAGSSSALAGSSSAPSSVFDPQSGYFSDHATLATDPAVHLLSCGELTLFLTRHFCSPLPPTDVMFPWLHGIHRNNYAQLQFLGRDQDEDLNLEEEEQLISPKVPRDVRNLMVVRSCNTMGEVSSAYSDIITESTGMIRGTVSADDILMSSQAITDLEDYLESVLGERFTSLFPIEELCEDCQTTGLVPVFKDMDPQFGVSLRNFHIQVSKMSNISDFIVYCFNEDHREGVHGASGGACSCAPLARLLHIAQLLYAEDHPEILTELPTYNTYVVEDPSQHRLEQANLLAIPVLDPRSSMKAPDDLCSAYDMSVFNNWDSNYLYRERLEISRMSTATPIGDVWLGNITDFECLQIRISNGEPFAAQAYDLPSVPLHCDQRNTIVTLTKRELDVNSRKAQELDSKLITFPKTRWRLFVHCYDGAQFPTLSELRSLFTSCRCLEQINIEFPPSGSLTLADMTEDDILALVNLCKLCYYRCDKDFPALFYCSDGYTETSLLAACYLMYSEQVCVDEALVKLHIKYGRPFFIFKTDYVLLEKLEQVLQTFSPKNNTRETSHCFHFQEKSSVIRMAMLSPNRGRTIGRSADAAGSFATATGHHEVQLKSSHSSVSAPVVTATPSVSSVGRSRSRNGNNGNGGSDEGYEGCLESVMGSLPSQILPHMYLGSLGHASSLPLLAKLGIDYVVSVGEHVGWVDRLKYTSRTTPSGCEILTIQPGQVDSDTGEACCVKQVMQIRDISDDGIGTLTTTIDDALEFLDVAYRSAGKAIVHCQVGVSRSATVCIAEAMRRINITLPRAYMFVRVRRLNVIIQPNLKLMYELFKWEEQFVSRKRGEELSFAPSGAAGRSSFASNSSSGSSGSLFSTNQAPPSQRSSLSTYCAKAPCFSQIAEEDAEAVQSDSDEDLTVKRLSTIVSDDEIISNTPGFLREVDWAIMCREIFNLNRAYIKPAY